MIYLALDLATSVGWSVGKPAGRPLFGTHVLPRTGPDVGRFLEAYRSFFTEMIRAHQPDTVVFEQPVLPAKTSLKTVRKLNSLAGATELFCLDLKIGCREARVQSWRPRFAGVSRAPRHITGSARRSKWLKQRVMEACQSRGWYPDTFDAADAIGILVYTIECDRAGRVAEADDGDLFRWAAA